MKYLKMLLMLPVMVFVLFNVWAYGGIVSVRALAPADTAFMRRSSLPPDYRWTDYGQIARPLKQAVIAAEDAQFVAHGGFDWDGIRAAAKRNAKAGNVRAGGSTISQQLAKNLFLNENRSYWRKGEEALITAMLEGSTDKRRIYELYLNVIEWGRGVYGAEAAAQTLYGRRAADINAGQAAAMAARIPAPRRYADRPHDPHLKRKTAVVARRAPSARIPE